MSALSPTLSPSGPPETPPSLEITLAERVFYTPDLIDEVCYFASTSALLGIMLTGFYGLTRGAKRLWKRTEGHLVDGLLEVRYSKVSIPPLISDLQEPYYVVSPIGQVHRPLRVGQLLHALQRLDQPTIHQLP
jgi:hypothetical protein